MKKLLLLSVVGLFAMTTTIAQNITTISVSNTNEWESFDCFDEFGDVNSRPCGFKKRIGPIKLDFYVGWEFSLNFSLIDKNGFIADMTTDYDRITMKIKTPNGKVLRHTQDQIEYYKSNKIEDEYGASWDHITFTNNPKWEHNDAMVDALLCLETGTKVLLQLQKDKGGDEDYMFIIE